MRIISSFPFVAVALAFVGCDSTPPAAICSPGVSIACVGAGGCAGGQVCNAEGSGYGACDCGGMIDGGPGDAQVAIDAEMSIDAFVATDAPPVDGGPITGCDPLTHAECGTGERCAWVNLTSDTGETRCVLDGTVAVGGACAYGADGDTGFDDCARGLACVGSVCATVCDFASSTSCGTDGACLRYAGLFASGEDDPVAGACVPSCNPLTNEPCATGQGCYELSSPTSVTFVCAGAGSVAVGETITGTVFANSCVPGARPIRPADGTIRCAGYCRPVETHSTATAGEAGEAPYRCQDVGGAATDACLFGWLFSSGPYDARFDELGVCLPDGILTYDHDMMPGTAQIAYPSCTTLVNTDTDGDGVPQHRQFGCAPQPAP